MKEFFMLKYPQSTAIVLAHIADQCMEQYYQVLPDQPMKFFIPKQEVYSYFNGFYSKGEIDKILRDPNVLDRDEECGFMIFEGEIINVF